ncbi:hypothetical protein QR685DRAFT_59192 [Neurospora intermedia]|uniref:dUTP diphosphatase n=1 Tax=Neurospora intermedia TaxID=5142 RepID=A0ABR3DSW3_NEUIN
MFVARRLLSRSSFSLSIVSQTTTTFKHFFATITPMTTGTTEPTASSPPAKRIKTSADSFSQTTTAATTTAATMTADTQTPVTKVDQAPPLLIKKLSDKARLPTRGSAFAAGYDIYASKETTIPARGKGLVDTDISMAVPAGTCTFSFIILTFSPSSVYFFFSSLISFGCTSGGHSVEALRGFSRFARFPTLSSPSLLLLALLCPSFSPLPFSALPLSPLSFLFCPSPSSTLRILADRNG